MAESDETLKQPPPITRNGRDRRVFRTEDLNPDELQAIANSEMDPAHHHLDAQLK